jgi:hypothetical protein
METDMIVNYTKMLRVLGLTEREIENLNYPANRVVAMPLLSKFLQGLRTETHTRSLLQLLASPAINQHH